jgi:predicted dithiol-disulfide oxidoreductase (DUF899 family)
MTLTHPPVVSQTEWDAALAAMTEREKAVAAAMHELAAERKRMPMVRVERDYSFEGLEGRRSLLELRLCASATRLLRRLRRYAGAGGVSRHLRRAVRRAV